MPTGEVKHVYVLLCRLCALINEALHLDQGKPGQSAIELGLYWIWGKCMLYVLHDASTEWRKKWSGFLRIHGVLASNYVVDRLIHPDVVYLKVSLDNAKAYVGSTECGMIARESNRRRKYKARKTQRDTEPAFLWWAKTSTYWDFVPIVVQLHECTIDAAKEEKRIQNVRQPELVAPWIWKYIDKPKSIELPLPQMHEKNPNQPLTPRRSSIGAWDNGPPPAWNNTRMLEAWSIICELAQKGMHSNFWIKRLAAERIISSEFVYYILKMSQHAEEPYRSFVRAKLRKSLELRGLSFPSPEKPLVTIFLRHDSFLTDIRSWLRNVIDLCKSHCIPHHLPQAMVLEGKAKTISSCLYNSKEFVAAIPRTGVPECKCSILRDFVPRSAYSKEGHLCVDFHELGPNNFLVQTRWQLLQPTRKNRISKRAGYAQIVRDRCLPLPR